MCGIAGIINKTPKIFDYSTFCTLGIANDIRGGDSCGIFIDGKYDYGINNNKLFANYFISSKLLNNIKESKIALLHCRKASIGSISKETAQPVIITEDNTIKFVVIHNGTIYNYKELAKKYIPNINITGLTDSQVMARIFYYSGYDVLNEYNGGSVFVIVDYRETFPKVLLFKGASKEHKYSEEITIERPLYFCIDKDKQELVFSSIGSYLVALRRNCIIYSVDYNVLLEFTGSDLAIVKKYNRKNCCQSKDTIGNLGNMCLYKSYFNRFDKYNSPYYDQQITCNQLDNTYTYNNRLIHGKLCINKYGDVNPKYTKKYDIWFFNGIVLKSERYFNFLTELKQRSGLSENKFNKRFNNVIRYCSIDGVFRIGNFWYKAISPLNCVLFTGHLQQITSDIISSFDQGIKKTVRCCSGTNFTAFETCYKNEVNFKAIEEECMSLMK